jgi:hypothetical protein
MMGEEAVVAKFEMLFRHLPGENENMWDSYADHLLNKDQVCYPFDSGVG